MIHESLAATLLQTLTPREQTAFRHFLQRPDRRVRDDVRRLYDALDTLPADADRKVAEKVVYGAAAVDHRRINQLLSWLYAEACAFLAEGVRGEDDPLLLLRELDRRGLPRHRDRLLRRLSRRPGGYRQQYALARARYEFGAPTSRTKPTNFQQLSDLADLAFIQEKLELACLMRSHQNVYATDYDYGMLTACLARLTPVILAEHPVIAAYYHAYHFLSDGENEGAFTAFQSIVLGNPGRFAADELRGLYLTGINYCIRRSNQGEADYARQALALYREGIDGGILLENGRISPYTYRNAVALSLKIRDFAWAERFIHEAAALLPRDQRDNLLHYNLASLAYHRGDRDRALEQLRFVHSNDTLFTLTLDTLRAKVYFENGDHELLAAHLDKMKIFLLRKGKSYHHRNYANFVRFLRKLGRQAQDASFRADKLRSAIEAEPQLTERRWLLGQLHEKGPTDE